MLLSVQALSFKKEFGVCLQIYIDNFEKKIDQNISYLVLKTTKEFRLIQNKYFKTVLSLHYSH